MMGTAVRPNDSLAIARAQLSAYFAFYNERRPHQSLDYRTPDAVYFEAPARTMKKAA